MDEGECMNYLLAIKRAEDKCRGRFIVPTADLSAAQDKCRGRFIVPIADLSAAQDKCRGRFIVPTADLSAHDPPLADQDGYSPGTNHRGR